MDFRFIPLYQKSWIQQANIKERERVKPHCCSLLFIPSMHFAFCWTVLHLLYPLLVAGSSISFKTIPTAGTKFYICSKACVEVKLYHLLTSALSASEWSPMHTITGEGQHADRHTGATHGKCDGYFLSTTIGDVSEMQITWPPCRMNISCCL